MGCCESVRVLRFWLLLQNLVLFLGAVALLAVSVDALVEEPRLEPLLHLSVARGTAVLLAAAASLVLLVSFLGCCGALTKRRWLLGLFGCCSILLLVLTLAGFTSALVASGPAADSVKRRLLDSMERYGDDTEDTAVWDFLQRDFHCCGVNNGSDWADRWADNRPINATVPSSCCRPAPNGTVWPCEEDPDSDNSYFDHGCFTSAQSLIVDHTAAFAGATAAVALFLVLSVTLTCFYNKMERQASYERLTV